MATGQITWEQFITSNNDARGVRFKFEDLCRQLFTYGYGIHDIAMKAGIIPVIITGRASQIVLVLVR